MGRNTQLSIEDNNGVQIAVYKVAYGSKLFSLALLFGSTVLLNSVKVLNDQFFAFFGEQQQLAAMIKDGLAKEGLPLEALGSEKLGNALAANGRKRVFLK